MSKNVKTAVVIGVILLALAIILYLLRKRLECAIIGIYSSSSPDDLRRKQLVCLENKYNGKYIKTGVGEDYYKIKNHTWYRVSLQDIPNGNYTQIPEVLDIDVVFGNGGNGGGNNGGSGGGDDGGSGGGDDGGSGGGGPIATGRDAGIPSSGNATTR